MRRSMAWWWLVAAFLTTPVAGFAQATIEGRVTLPPPKKGAAATPRYQTTAGAPAKVDGAAAVVYLEGTFTATNAPAKAELGQKNFQFMTPLLPVQKGAMVEFPNHDDDYHNVFSYSKPKRFDLGRYRKDEKPATITFNQPGVVKLYCEIHDHMRATILVLDTPYFVKTDAEGNFKLTNLPDGKYTLKVWADDKTTEKAVELKAGETVKVDFPSL
ncbi:MAG: carboxypeptidase regulatory-like domain-containing protein [Verrucomicrobiota bacterium]